MAKKQNNTKKGTSMEEAVEPVVEAPAVGSMEVTSPGVPDLPVQGSKVVILRGLSQLTTNASGTILPHLPNHIVISKG